MSPDLANETSLVGVYMDGQALTDLQRLSSRHIAFSVTEACPLQCKHCIVSTISPSGSSRTLSMAQAEAYATQMGELAQRGIEYISFTGGEPVLAYKQINILAESAVQNGIECSIVTSCHWAKTLQASRRIVSLLHNIHSWHLSMDVFHEEFLPIENIMFAIEALQEASKKIVIRMAAAIPLSSAHIDLYNRIRAAAPVEVPVVIQPLTMNGRARDIQSDIPVQEVPAWPCIPNGLVVRYDGTVAPCCAGLVDERKNHPFQYGNAVQKGLAAIHEEWCTDPILQLIRSVGFLPILEWIKEEDAGNAVLENVPRHPCECCIRLWKKEKIRDLIIRKCNETDNYKKIGTVVAEVFDETYMLKKLSHASTQ